MRFGCGVTLASLEIAMEKEIDGFVAAIRWLAEGGRSHARLLAERADNDDQFDADIEEASNWITDIADGNEI